VNGPLQGAPGTAQRFRSRRFERLTNLKPPALPGDTYSVGMSGARDRYVGYHGLPSGVLADLCSGTLSLQSPGSKVKVAWCAPLLLDRIHLESAAFAVAVLSWNATYSRGVSSSSALCGEGVHFPPLDPRISRHSGVTTVV